MFPNHSVILHQRMRKVLMVKHHFNCLTRHESVMRSLFLATWMLHYLFCLDVLHLLLMKYVLLYRKPLIISIISPRNHLNLFLGMICYTLSSLLGIRSYIYGIHFWNSTGIFKFVFGVITHPKLYEFGNCTYGLFFNKFMLQCLCIHCDHCAILEWLFSVCIFAWYN